LVRECSTLIGLRISGERADRLLRAAERVERIGGEHSSPAFCVSYFILKGEFEMF